MALTVGQLRVQLEARTQAFRAGMKRAQAQVRTFATRSRAALRGVGRAFRGLRANIGTLSAGAGIVGALGLALVAATKAAAGSVDQIAKSARQANITATEFQRLTFAAEEAGVETTGMANSLLLFNRNIGEALTGIGPGAEAFAALGVNINNADGSLKSIQTLFGETADAISKIPSGAQRAQIAFDLFGRQGAKLAPLLATGSAAIREAGDEAERLGLIFSEDTVANAELVNDAFGRLGRAIDVQVKSALIELAPTLLRLAGTLLPKLITGLRIVVGAFGILRGVLATVQAILVAVLSPITFLIRTLVDLVAIAFEAGDVIGNVFTGNFKAAAEGAKKLGADFGTRVVGNFKKGFNEISAAGSVAADAFKDFTDTDDALAKVGEKFSSVAASAESFAAAITDGSAAARAAAENAGRDASTFGGADPNALASEKAAIAAQKQGASALLALENQRAQSAAALLGPSSAQVFALEQQVVALRAANLSDEDRIRANKLINTLVGEQTDLIAGQERATAAIPELTTQVSALIASLTTLDPEGAIAFTEQLRTGVESAVGPEGKEAALIALGEEVAGAIDTATKEAEIPSIGDNVAQSISDGFQTALTGGGFDGFLDGLAGALQKSSEDALNEAFASATEGLADLIDGALGGLGGGKLGSAIAGIAGSLIAASLQEDDVQSSAANVSSAITSSQQVRGLAVGPTSIGIAQVQRGIQEAFVEPTRLLRILARSNELIAANTSGGGGTTASFGGGDEATDALANEGPSFV